MAGSKITAERLRELLSYNPDTGIFTWNIRRLSFAGKAAAGAVAGSPHGNGYIEIGIDGEKFFAHRLAWFFMTGQWPAASLDHINRVRHDNRWENLRCVNDKQNQENRNVRKDSKSGIKGIDLLPSGRWRAKIKHNYKIIHIGVFDTKELAAEARADAERRLFTHAPPQV